MGLFDDYFDPQQYQPGRGLTGWLEALQQQQGYQPGAGFDSWPQTGPPAKPATDGAPGQQPALLQATPPMPAIQPVSSSVGNVPMPTPRPGDIPLQSIAIGDYLMPQFGAAQASQYTQTQPELADRLGAGFKSWAYTPVGSPFAALANAITGFSSGQFTAAPTLKPQSPQLRQVAQPSEDDTIIPVPIAPAPTQSTVRVLPRRGRVPRR